MAKGTTKASTKAAATTKGTTKKTAAPAAETIEVNSQVPPIPPEFAVGVVTTFAGYAEELEAGQEPLFAAGESVTITEIKPEKGEIIVASADGQRAETLFADELNLPPETKATAGTKKSAAKPTTKGGAATKAAAASTATTKGAATTKAGAKGTTKGTTKGAVSTKGTTKGTTKAAVQEVVAVAEEPLVATPAVQALMDESNPTAVLEAARSLIDQYEETYFTLGGVLTFIYHNETYKELGEDYAGKQGWQKYLEEVLGLGYRKAMTLIDMYKVFSGLEVDEKRLTTIGWTKVREVSRHMTAENAEELLNFAEEHTREEVADYVKTNYATDTGGRGSAQPAGERVKKVTYKFSVLDTEVESVNEALEAAKKAHEVTDIGPAIAAICVDWLQLVGGNNVTLEEVIERVQAQFNVVLEVVESEEAAE